jgi:hypothetical protein
LKRGNAFWSLWKTLEPATEQPTVCTANMRTAWPLWFGKDGAVKFVANHQDKVTYWNHLDF